MSVRPIQFFEELVGSALKEALDVEAPALVTKAQDPKFGDYQSNAAMPLGKKLGKAPREIAEKVAAVLRTKDALSTVEVAGPGFLNLTMSPSFVGAHLAAALGDERDGVPKAQKKQTIVVDYSSPNIAKQMHVGHLRSTIIGHALCELFRFIGHDVIGDNHVGDWGTQYGLLIAGLRRSKLDGASLSIVDLERIYKEATALSESDPAFADEARRELAKLQAGDKENHALWETFVAVTRVELDKVYARLGVHFDQWLGESTYDPMLPGVVERLLGEKIARIDNGAVCIFFKEWADAPKELAKQEQPFIVRKSDGAFLYATTDIATAIYRQDHFHADRSVYVIDSRQSLHMKQLMAVATKLGIPTKLEHVGFGMVLGNDGKPLRTRDASGAVLTLSALLDEAEERARNVIVEQGLDVPESELANVARAVGLGAVKYADLRQNRASDYQFDWDKLIEFKGNAGPYLQYAAARIGAIFRKGEIDPSKLRVSSLSLTEKEEFSLARELLRFPDVVHTAAETSMPHVLTDHLYAVAREFSSFYEACPVLKAEGAVRESRLALSALSLRQLKRGLGLLGIETVERM